MSFHVQPPSWLYVLGVPLLPRLITEHAHSETGIDLERAIDTARWIEGHVGHAVPGLLVKAGDFPGDIVAVVGNHQNLATAAAGYGLPFFHVPVSAETRAAAEARQLEILRELRVVLVRVQESPPSVLRGGWASRPSA